MRRRYRNGVSRAETKFLCEYLRRQNAGSLDDIYVWSAINLKWCSIQTAIAIWECEKASGRIPPRMRDHSVWRQFHDGVRFRRWANCYVSIENWAEAEFGWTEDQTNKMLQRLLQLDLNRLINSKKVATAVVG
jgi:hypothetical protein